MMHQVQDENCIKILDNLIEMSMLEIFEEALLKQETTVNKKKIVLPEDTQSLIVDILVMMCELMPNKIKLYMISET